MKSIEELKKTCDDCILKIQTEAESIKSIRYIDVFTSWYDDIFCKYIECDRYNYKSKKFVTDQEFVIKNLVPIDLIIFKLYGSHREAAAMIHQNNNDYNKKKAHKELYNCEWRVLKMLSDYRCALLDIMDAAEGRIGIKRKLCSVGSKCANKLKKHRTLFCHSDVCPNGEDCEETSEEHFEKFYHPED